MQIHGRTFRLQVRRHGFGKGRGTLMVDTYATSYYNKSLLNKATPVEEMVVDGHVHVHTYATNGHAHGSILSERDSDSSELLRHRVISQVLELGIIVYSVIIGISLGASETPKTIKPLVAALTFHQIFEGMGLGGCIAQAKFKSQAIAIMAVFFSLTTPIGIVIGIGITNIYKENNPTDLIVDGVLNAASVEILINMTLVDIVIGIGITNIYKVNNPTALIVEGVLNAASAGILIYMTLVDLLAADFMNPRMQNNGKLQLLANASLLFGVGFKSLLAKWFGRQ